jgi:hypothetical protein
MRMLTCSFCGTLQWCMGSCNIYHKCQVSCDSHVLCKLVDSPVLSRLIMSSRYMRFNIVWENCFERFTGSIQYQQSISDVSQRREPSLSAQQCDITTSEMRGLSPKIISGDSRLRKHTHKHTIPNMKFKLKLLQIKCYVLGFTKDIAQNMLQKIIRVFTEAFISHDSHTLFALEESESPRMTYTYESQ